MDGLLQRISEPSPSGGLTRPAWIVLMLLAAVTLFTGIFSIPPMDRDESRYAQASRQMMETGDYLNINFQEYDRHKQPAMTYWLQTVAAAPFGDADAPIGAHRLPGFLFALLAVAITAWMGARFFTPPVGFAAGLILAICLTLAVEARTAKTDAILLGFGMIAQASLMVLMLQVKEARPKFIGWPALLWGAIGVTLLVKGPIFFMVTALTAIVFTAWKRDPKLLLRLRPEFGIPLALLIFGPWFIAINLETEWAFYYEAVGHSMLDKVGEAQEAHSGPLGFHVGLTAVTLWPGFALLALGVMAAWANRHDDRVKFLIAWIIPVYIVFEIVATKLPHYTLPAFPAIALLIGLGIANASSLLSGTWRRVAQGVFGFIAVAVGLILSAAPVIANYELGRTPDLAAWITIAFGGVAAVAIIILVLHPSVKTLIGTAVAASALYASAFAVAIPAIDPLWTSDRVARIANSFEGCEAQDRTIAGYREPSTAFNLGTATWLAHTGEDAAQYLLENRQCGLAIVDVAEEEAFRAVTDAAGVELRALAQMDGYNAVKGDELSLTFYTVAESDLRAPAR